MSMHELLAARFRRTGTGTRPAFLPPTGALYRPRPWTWPVRRSCEAMRGPSRAPPAQSDVQRTVVMAPSCKALVLDVDAFLTPPAHACAPHDKLAKEAAKNAVSRPATERRGPRQGRDMRVCVSTRQRINRHEMWRIVRISKNNVALDHGQGRSAYISQSLEAVLEARKKNRIGRALRAAVPGAIYDELVQRAMRIAAEGPCKKK
jgi:uncharacterized protein